MEYLKEYNKFKKEYYVLYTSPLSVSQTNMHLFNAYPYEFKRNWTDIITKLNIKHEQDLIVPLDYNRIQVGCVVSLDTDIESLVNDIYNELSKLTEIIIVYGKGELEILNKLSLHYCYGDILIKTGHLLDKTKTPGIYKI